MSIINIRSGRPWLLGVVVSASVVINVCGSVESASVLADDESLASEYVTWCEGLKGKLPEALNSANQFASLGRLPPRLVPRVVAGCVRHGQRDPYPVFVDAVIPGGANAAKELVSILKSATDSKKRLFLVVCLVGLGDAASAVQPVLIQIAENIDEANEVRIAARIALACSGYENDENFGKIADALRDQSAHAKCIGVLLYARNYKWLRDNEIDLCPNIEDCTLVDLVVSAAIGSKNSYVQSVRRNVGVIIGERDDVNALLVVMSLTRLYPKEFRAVFRQMVRRLQQIRENTGHTFGVAMSRFSRVLVNRPMYEELRSELLEGNRETAYNAATLLIATGSRLERMSGDLVKTIAMKRDWEGWRRSLFDRVLSAFGSHLMKTAGG